MSLFASEEQTDRYGVLIDIGSGSVLAAIVHSNRNQKQPNIIWAHREHAPLRNIDSLKQSTKAVITALMNVTMMLDVEGRKVLYDHTPKAKLTEIQCSISAPWSYTVTKTINYNQKEAFTVTEELLRDLIQTINKKTKEDLRENETLHELGLQLITHVTMDMLVNGYHINDPEGEKAEQLTISRASVVTQEYLVSALKEMEQKLFNNTKTHKLSFILLFYAVTREVLAQIYDVCLVDVTYEATEIGIVRDGVLHYSTHTPYGSFSLAREISNVTNVPLHEAFGYLHTEKPYSFMESLTKPQRDEIDAIFDAYTEKVAELFKETGDELSIPKQISLHADLNSESLFLDLIERAAKRTLKTAPHVTAISHEIIKQFYTGEKDATGASLPVDTAMLLSAQFFHKQLGKHRFEYL